VNEDDKKELHRKIIKEVKETKEKISTLGKMSKPIAPDNAIGRLTRMEAINAKSINDANIRTAKIRLMNLEKALERINDPDFGICQICEKQIPLKRLMIVPESNACVQCLENLK
jgi:DnaK suppressor protein